MSNSRANLLKSSPASCDTRVFSSASALPVCESSPAERDQSAAAESVSTPEGRAAASLWFWLGKICDDGAAEFSRLASELKAERQFMTTPSQGGAAGSP